MKSLKIRYFEIYSYYFEIYYFEIRLADSCKSFSIAGAMSTSLFFAKWLDRSDLGAIYSLYEPSSCWAQSPGIHDLRLELYLSFSHLKSFDKHVPILAVTKLAIVVSSHDYRFLYKISSFPRLLAHFSYLTKVKRSGSST